jgi:predicted DNA-binding helix-hairpin-helix protein
MHAPPRFGTATNYIGAQHFRKSVTSFKSSIDKTMVDARNFSVNIYPALDRALTNLAVDINTTASTFTSAVNVNTFNDTVLAKLRQFTGNLSSTQSTIPAINASAAEADTKRVAFASAYASFSTSTW